MNLYSIIAVIVSAGWCSSAVAATKEPRLGHLTPTEITFLMQHAPEINQVISSGVVVVHGDIIEPPILVTINRDKIEIGGLQVVPRQERPAYFMAKKKADRIHEQYFLQKKSGGQAAEERARRDATDMMNNGELSSFEFKNTKNSLLLTAKSGGKEWPAYLDSLCPAPLSDKYYFVMSTIFRAYNLKKELIGKTAAINWLHARFADMKAMGILGTYQFSDEDETVDAKFSCASHRGGFGFYGAKSPRGLAYEKHWKSKEPETKRELEGIIKNLASGQLLIYTFGFDKKIPSNPAIVKLLEDVASGKLGKAKSASSLQETIGLTPEQVDKLLEELR